ncbi:hypothetical protein C8Q78DRAFT_845830 [Trametes maxima]|nr:hypothetical protein C8Q78DRAFT_845830 [Trametes maxima]
MLLCPELGFARVATLTWIYLGPSSYAYGVDDTLRRIIVFRTRVYDCRLQSIRPLAPRQFEHREPLRSSRLNVLPAVYAGESRMGHSAPLRRPRATFLSGPRLAAGADGLRDEKVCPALVAPLASRSLGKSPFDFRNGHDRRGRLDVSLVRPVIVERATITTSMTSCEDGDFGSYVGLHNYPSPVSPLVTDATDGTREPRGSHGLHRGGSK